jgi:hypothetical protein
MVILSIEIFSYTSLVFLANGCLLRCRVSALSPLTTRRSATPSYCDRGDAGERLHPAWKHGLFLCARNTMVANPRHGSSSVPGGMKRNTATKHLPAV